MDYNKNSLMPIIHSSEYDQVAEEFLNIYYQEALREPMPVPILEIAKNKLRLNIQMVCLSEELDIYGITIFTDGMVDVYLTDEGVYESRFFKRRTVLIDPTAYMKTNTGCVNNTVAHECVHWYKHRFYYKMQEYTLPQQAKYCKCYLNEMPAATEEDIILENQAVGIAPRILMPKGPFVEAAEKIGVEYGSENKEAVVDLANIFNVSKQSVRIRLEECSLI